MNMNGLRDGQSPEALALIDQHRQKQQAQQEEQATLAQQAKIEEQATRARKDTMKVMGLCVVVATIMLFMFSERSGDSKTTSTVAAEAQTVTAPTAEPTVLRMGDAVVGGHDFQFLELADGRVIALFSPMLPRNDRLLTRAIAMVVLNAFADVVTSDPRVEGQWIVVSSEKHTYRVLIVKEDTGEVHTMQVERA